MKPRTILRMYAQSKGKEAVSFVRIDSDYYSEDLITLDSKGNEERISLSYKELFHWLTSTNKIKITKK